MKIIYISGATGTGKTTALETLVGKGNIFYDQKALYLKEKGVTSVGLDEYRGEPIDESIVEFLNYTGVTHLYIATEYLPKLY